jgi:hypothetical protein
VKAQGERTVIRKNGTSSASEIDHGTIRQPESANFRIAAELVTGHEPFVTTPDKSLDTVGELLPERWCECSVKQIRHFSKNMGLTC